MISKFKPFQGPLQFVFKDPDTGMQYGPEVSKKALLDRIILFREQNGHPEIEYLSQVVENYWCGLRENTGRCVLDVMPLGIMATLRGGIAVLKNYMYKSFVKQEVAERRAKQCSTCPHNNQDPEVKSWSDWVALNSVGSKRTAQYDRLGKCRVCRCALNMKVFYDGKIAKPTEEEQKKYEEIRCWQLEIIE